MHISKIEKVRKFLADKDMEGTIHEVLLKAFLKKRSDADVNLKAAQMVAVELLEEGWKELEKLKAEGEQSTPDRVQPGL